MNLTILSMPLPLKIRLYLIPLPGSVLWRLKGLVEKNDQVIGNNDQVLSVLTVFLKIKPLLSSPLI